MNVESQFSVIYVSTNSNFTENAILIIVIVWHLLKPVRKVFSTFSFCKTYKVVFCC